MRIAHVSDTHLGYRQYNLDEREKDIYEAFNEAVDRAVEERADVLIHSGDLFDSPTPPIRALYVFKSALRRIDGKMKVYTVLGDHDTPKRRGMPPHKLFDVRVLGVRRLEWEEVGGVLIAGISNLRGRGVELLKRELGKFDAIAEKYEKSVLVAHQAIERYLPFEGAYELKEDDLPRKATYYAFGHLHSRIAVRFGGGYLAYAGSTEIIRKDEISSWSRRGKGFYLVDLDRDEVTVHEINLDIRPQLEVEVEEERLEEVLSFVRHPHNKPPILHITVKGENVNRQHVIGRLSELLKDKVLSFKPSFRDLSRQLPPELPRGVINLESIMREYLGGDELARLAMSILDRLSQDDIEGARRVVEEFLEG